MVISTIVISGCTSPSDSASATTSATQSSNSQNSPVATPAAEMTNGNGDPIQCISGMAGGLMYGSSSDISAGIDTLWFNIGNIGGTGCTNAKDLKDYDITVTVAGNPGVVYHVGTNLAIGTYVATELNDKTKTKMVTSLKPHEGAVVQLRVKPMPPKTTFNIYESHAGGKAVPLRLNVIIPDQIQKNIVLY
jgi:hypothetical protein